MTDFQVGPDEEVFGLTPNVRKGVDMRDATPPFPPGATFGDHRPAVHSDTQYLLEELDVLYPLIAYWDVPEAGDSAVEIGRLDEDALDEAIFTGMVALR
jgi:hypothetical protein